MKVKCLDTLENAWTTAEDWQRLSRKNPLLSPEWLLSWWKYYGGANQLMVLQCEDADGHVIGIAPFYLQKEFGSIAIRSLGSGDVCSDYVQILCEEGFEKEVSLAVTDYLTDFFGRYSTTPSAYITIDGVERDAPWLEAFCAATESQGYRNWLQPIQSSFRLTLPESMNEYLQSLGSSAKRKGKRLLSKLRAGAVTLGSSEESGDVRASLCELQRIHQARRTMLGQPGCFSDDRFESFVKEAVVLLGSRGLARIDCCEFEGKAIAADLVLKGTDTLFMYQSGIDPAYMKLEPGHILTVASIQRAIESGVRYYDTLRGDEQYKTYWGGEAIPLVTLHCRPPHLLSQFAGFSHFQFWHLKQAAKRFLNATKSAPIAVATK